MILERTSWKEASAKSLDILEISVAIYYRLAKNRSNKLFSVTFSDIY